MRVLLLNHINHVTSNYKSDFKYTVYFYEISSSTSAKVAKGSIDIDPSDLKLIKDNTDAQSGSDYLSTYSVRIQKLVDSANKAFGQDIN